MNSYLRAVAPVRPPAPWQGGKRALAKTLTSRIAEVPHATYIEPFVGMGGIFFRRTMIPDQEVINDLNGEVVNLFRILQRHYSAFMDHLKFQLTSRREFERLAQLNPDTLTDLERAARFLYLQRLSYGGKVRGQNFGVNTGGSARFDYSKIGPVLEDVFERLTGVVIETLDWSVLVEKYDSPDALFYLDPPYYDCETDYGEGMFSKHSFGAMANQLAALKGKAIISLNDTPEVRDIFGAFRIEAVDVTYFVGQASGGAKEAKEVIISNFEPPEAPLFQMAHNAGS